MSEFSCSRESAAQFLEVSKRTLDRYVRDGRLSYKKIGNKVFLSEDEVKIFKQENNIESDLVVEGAKMYKRDEEEIQMQPQMQPQTQPNTQIREYDEMFSKFENNFDKLVELIKEKDEQLEEKNKLLFLVQQKTSSLEEKLKNAIALPDYTKEKENLQFEKEKITYENEIIKNELKQREIRNIFNITIILFLVLVIVMVVLYGNNK